MAALGAVVLIGLSGTTASASTNISIQPPLSQAQVGDTVTVRARVQGQDSVGWFYVRIFTDNTVLTYLSCGPGITTGCPRGSQCMECGPTGEPGIVSVTCACMGTGTCVAPGDLVIIKYVAAAVGVSPVEFDLASVSDCERMMIPLGMVEDGEVIVGMASVDTGDQAWNCEISSFSCCPNPFANAAVLQYCVSDFGAGSHMFSGDPEITIYDCRGRLVRSIAAGLAAGEHRVTWDGSDQDGATVSPGAYFCRFPVAGGVRTFKIVKAN